VAAEVPVKLGVRILLLLVLVAGVGSYIWLQEIPNAEREGKKEKLVGVDKDAVTGVDLVYPDREIELRKDDKGWRVTKPVDAPADDTVVKAVVATVADADVQKTLDQAPSDLAPFGLDKPTVTVRLTVKDGAQPPAIAVGKNTAIGGKTYVKKGDDPKLYLTTSSIGYGLNKQVKDVRDKSVLAFKDDDVTKIEIRPQGGAPVTLVKQPGKDAPDAAWTVAPGDHPADPTEVRSYLSSLRATRATDFPDDHPTDLAKYGLTDPRLAVTVTTGKDATATAQTLLVGGETTEGSQKLVYAKRDDQPTVYALGDWSFRTLGKTAGQFRDKTVLGFDPARVGRAVLERKDGGAITMARADGAWKVEGADGKKTKESVVQAYLQDVRELRGSDVAAEPAKDLRGFGLDAPDLKVALTDKDGQPIGTVLAAKHDGKYYVTRAGSDTVFEARDYMYARLDKHEKDFVEEPGATTTTLSPPAAPPADEPPDAGDDEDGD
jgi:hypothetical protein